MGYVGGHWYSEPPSCRECGGRLANEAEHCRCGGRSQFYSGANQYHGPDSRALDDEWAGEAGALLETELEARARPMHWTQAMAILRRRYRADS